MKVWIVTIMEHPELLAIPFADRYKIFADDKKYEALEWAKENGYQVGFLGVTDEIGKFSYRNGGGYCVGIMHAVVN